MHAPKYKFKFDLNHVPLFLRTFIEISRNCSRVFDNICQTEVRYTRRIVKTDTELPWKMISYQVAYPWGTTSCQWCTVSRLIVCWGEFWWVVGTHSLVCGYGIVKDCLRKKWIDFFCGGGDIRNHMSLLSNINVKHFKQKVFHRRGGKFFQVCKISRTWECIYS